MTMAKMLPGVFEVITQAEAAARFHLNSLQDSDSFLMVSAAFASATKKKYCCAQIQYPGPNHVGKQFHLLSCASRVI